MRITGKTSLLGGAAMLLLSAPAPAQECPAGALANPKSSTLYMVYSGSDDSDFPEFGDVAEPTYNVDTSPLAAFDLSDLDDTIGTEADLRDRVHELVEAGYCEFDVEVQTTTSYPTSPPEDRWQIVGIGSDNSGDGLVGLAQDVDTGDSDARDHARFWVDSLADFAGGELTGTDSTLERWATGMANLVAHESGHNYGGAHGDGVAETGEDATENHFMTNPALGATPDSIVDSFNHFSDSMYEILGHNLGLNIKTLHNWDFTNPNDTNADALTITLLSEAESLTIGWSYGGSRSPWTSPTVTNTGDDETFRGETYNVHELEFTDPKSWSDGPDGEAPPGVEFHVGASFAESDPVIVYETTLHDGGADLSLKPRLFGYDAGTDDDGAFSVRFFNPSPEEGFVELRDLQVRFLPRMLDIEAMVEGAELTGLHGAPVTPFDTAAPLRDPDTGEPRKAVRIGEQPLELDLAQLTEERHIDIHYDPDDCPNQRGSHPGGEGGAGFGVPASPDYCQDGTALSLFPATYTYVTATLVDPDARQWDPSTGTFVERPLTTRVFFQVAGTVPDFNENGVDDLLDIRNGTSQDQNGNGVPDEAEAPPGDGDGTDGEPEPEPDQDRLWLWILMILVVLILLVILIAAMRRSS